MKKIKVEQATKEQLNWQVAKAKGHELMLFDTLWRDNAALKGYPAPDVERHLQWQPQRGRQVVVELRQLQLDQRNLEHLTPTRCAADIPDYATDWAQGGPIFSEARIAAAYDRTLDLWDAFHPLAEFDGVLYKSFYGPTELIAKARCFVAVHLGLEVEVPEELT